MTDLYDLYIDKNENIFLDGKQVKGVKAYTLSHSAGSNEPATLTLTVYVNVAQTGSNNGSSDAYGNFL